MPDSTSINIARFIHQYKGIEGFYFLNRKGELGYIHEQSQRTIKEAYPQAEDRNFLRIHPNFLTQIEGFLESISGIPQAYANGTEGIEMGYILPVGENHAWRSATLVLHRQIVSTLQRDDKILYSRGLKDPFQSNPEVDKTRGVRSIQQGFDDLLHHKDAFGVYKYFPVLFKLAANDSTRLGPDTSDLRVLNLKWRDHGTAPAQASDYLTHQTVFSILRANLIKRGAIARHKRLQNRFAVS